MKPILFSFCVAVFLPSMMAQQPRSSAPPDISNKALITKQTPSIPPLTTKSTTTDIAALHRIAEDYYAWRNENFPVGSSEAGLHTWDDRLTDYAPAKIDERARHVRELLDKVRARNIETWLKDERIDAILFRAQLEGADFGNRVLKFERTNPQVYVGECTNAIFTLLKKEYDTPRKRALAATARMKLMPALL